MPVSPEQNLISAVLRTKDIKTAVGHGVNADQFHAFADEWTWIENYTTKYRRTPSRVAFKEEFPEFYVRQVDDVEHYSDAVRKNHSRIVLAQTMRLCTDLIAEGKVDTAVANMHTSITQVASNLGVIKDSDIITDWSGIFEAAATRKKKFEEQGYSGIPTGFETLDETTGGMQPGQHWVVGARLGVGKSWTLMRMATTALMDGFTVQYNSLEMPRNDVSMRFHTFLSSDVGMSIFRSLDLMQGRNFDIREYKRFLTSLKTTIKGSLHVNDAKMGPMELVAQIERNRPDVVFIDYLTLMRVAANGDRWVSIGTLSKEIHDVAKDYDVAIVSAAQLNREHGLNKNEPAGPEALSESDAIGHDADVVITMRPMSETAMMMKMAKNRHGRSGFKWYCEFNPTAGIYKEVSHDRALELKDADATRADVEATKPKGGLKVVR